MVDILHLFASIDLPGFHEIVLGRYDFLFDLLPSHWRGQTLRPQMLFSPGIHQCNGTPGRREIFPLGVLDLGWEDVSHIVTTSYQIPVITRP